MLISRTLLNSYSPYFETISRGSGTPQENLCEFAARHCYASEDNMGHNPNFLLSLIKRGHMDVFEHSWVALDLSWADSLGILPDKWMYSVVVSVNTIIKSSSLRIWLRSVKIPADRVKKSLFHTSPHLFGEYEEYNGGLGFIGEYDPFPVEHKHPDSRVSLIAANVGHDVQDPIRAHKYNDIFSATFMIKGISRACSHQIVRHRNLSFSQISQRYVDLFRSDWGMVIPESFNDEQKSIMAQFQNQVTKAYRELRDSGARKEDARFVLPNACSTSMVVTGNFTAWKHFLDLRLPKDAQWEIRGVAEAIRSGLKFLAPQNFEKY